jgi:hypothetical protein
LDTLQAKSKLIEIVETNKSRLSKVEVEGLNSFAIAVVDLCAASSLSNVLTSGPVNSSEGYLDASLRLSSALHQFDRTLADFDRFAWSQTQGLCSTALVRLEALDLPGIYSLLLDLDEESPQVIDALRILIMEAKKFMAGGR